MFSSFSAVLLLIGAQNMTLNKTSFTIFEYLFVILLTLIFILIVKYYFSKKKYFQLGAKLPGPKPWPIIGNVLDFLDVDTNALPTLGKYRKNYDSFALWFGHHLVFILNTSDLAESYCRSSKLLNRTKRTKISQPLAEKGLLFANDAQWRKAKKLMEAAFPYSAMKTFLPVFQKEGYRLIKSLENEVGKPCFSLETYMRKCIFDIVTEVTMEFREDENLEAKLLKDVELLIKLSTKRVFNVWQQCDFLFKLSSDGKEFYRLVDSLTDMTYNKIREKREKYEEEKKKQKCDGHLSETKRKISWQVILDDKTSSMEELRDHIFSLVVAGYETSTNATCFALVMLALHPEIQEKAYQEILSEIDGDFDEINIQKLKYMEMIIKETLRLFPVVPIIFRSASDDVQIGEYLIPAEADVGINLYELHRDPKQFKNPKDFNPDNFLPENIAQRHPYSYIPFANGQRKCIGSKFSMYILKVLLSIILMNYKLECDYKTMDDIKTRFNISLTMPDGFQVKILKR